MAIKVNVRRLSAWHNDIPDQIRVDKLNEVAEDFANEIAHELGGLRCAQHPEDISYITVIAHRNYAMVVQTKFCCPEFENKVSLKIER